MEVFRDLLVTASSEQMEAVVAAIEQASPSDWSLDKALGDRLQSGSTPGKRSHVYYFVRQQNGSRPAVTLALMEKDKEPGRYFVPNIVPTAPPPLTRGLYNATLEDFVERVFKPVADPVGVAFTLTEPHEDLEDWLPKDAAEKLREFSGTAIRGLGASHPDDRAKWNAFVLAAHKGRTQLDAGTLKRWLTEVEGWNAEVAGQLADEYHYGRELLGYSMSRGGI